MNNLRVYRIKYRGRGSFYFSPLTNTDLARSPRSFVGQIDREIDIRGLGVVVEKDELHVLKLTRKEHI